MSKTTTHNSEARPEVRQLNGELHDDELNAVIGGGLVSAFSQVIKAVGDGLSTAARGG